jgi:hypothetical protein
MVRRTHSGAAGVGKQKARIQANTMFPAYLLADLDDD